MPIKNNRNSRDDKSNKSNNSARPESSSSGFRKKPEKTGNSDTTKKKLFGADSGRNSQSFSNKAGDRANSYTGKKPFNRDSSASGEKNYKKPFGEKRTFNSSSDGGEKRFERRPFSDRPQGERKPYGSSDGSRPDRKPFNSDRPQSDRKPYGDRPQGERKPFNKDAKNFDRKPLASRTDDNFRPYDREKNYRSDDRKWSSEENLRSNNRSKKPTASAKDDGLIRLNRFIANAGICSRRKADELIAAGVVSVNGEAVTELGFKVDPAKDLIRYNGEALKREKMVYVLLNKPKDYITTTDDPQERKTVMGLVEKASRERIYPVGRLDRNTTGLLLMTNDGDLAEKLSHPRNNVTKIYQVELNRNVPQGDLNKISFGLELEDGLIKPDQVSYVTGGSKNEIGIQIHSGKNRIVRRIFEHLGYEVVKLDRVVYSNLTKKDLPRGKWRFLEEKEIIQLKHLIK